MKEVMATVVCAHCGWTGRRKTGQTVLCPVCGEWATFDNSPFRECARDGKGETGKCIEHCKQWLPL